MSLTPLIPPPRKVSMFLTHIFCLTGHEWSLTYELNFRENTAPHFYSHANDTNFHIKGFKMHHEFILKVSVLGA